MQDGKKLQNILLWNFYFNTDKKNNYEYYLQNIKENTENFILVKNIH